MGKKKKKLPVLDLSRKRAPCPRCGTDSPRHSLGHRTIQDVDRKIRVIYSKHGCPKCLRYFGVSVNHIAYKASSYSNRVRWLALDLYRKGLTVQAVEEQMRKRHGLKVPQGTIYEWISTAGINRRKKSTSTENSS